MTVDPLKLDNPLNAENVARQDFPIQFPARYQFDVPAVVQSGLIMQLGTLACVGAAYIFVRLVPEFAMAVGQCSLLLVVALTISIIVRWESRSLPAFYTAVVVAVLCLVSVASSVFVSGGNQSLSVSCTLVMLGLLWNAAEVAIHFQSIDAEIIRHNPTLAQQRRERNVGTLQVLAVMVGIVECFALWAPIRLMLVPVTALVAATIAYLLVADFDKYPVKFLVLTLKHFLCYPDESSLAPGLIQSAVPTLFLRLFPFAIVLIGSVLIAVADRASSNLAVSALAMAMCGLLTGLAAMLIGASLSARPIHFDANRTPFEAVISKLRTEGAQDE